MKPSLLPIALADKPLLSQGETLLAADVGGTKTHLAIFVMLDGVPFLMKEAIFPSRRFNSLPDMVKRFFMKPFHPKRFAIAFAGPTQDGKAKATNLDWSVDIQEISKALGIPQVFLLNDLEAEAYGLAALKEKDFENIYPGNAPATGNAAIIAPGTGLGEAGLFWDGKIYHPLATEGGHTDFAPRNELDWELLKYLQKKYGHVSWERVVTGPGICMIFSFLRDVRKWEAPASLKERMRVMEPAEAIGKAALECVPICEETIRLFTKYLAVEASNLVLKLKATGGIFIGGGIVPKIWNESFRGVFLRHFFQVGRMRPLLEATPVHLIMNQNTPLLGGAWYAAFAGKKEEKVIEIEK